MNRFLPRARGFLIATGVLASAAATGALLVTRASAAPGASVTEADVRELADAEQAIVRFETAAKEFRGVVSTIVKQEFQRKRRDTEDKYDLALKETERDEKLRRADAIALFEQFLAKYPTDHRWTPDVIFRLAELYFERSNDEYLAAVDSAQKANAENDGKTESNAPPTPDYQRTIDLYKRLIAEFGDYRLIDGAHYLLGYCLGEMNREPESRQALLALVCKNRFRALDPAPPPDTTSPRPPARAAFIDTYGNCEPIRADSRFNPEAWTRIGELHFDAPRELEQSVSAYQRVLAYKDSPYFDKALYKLAWAYYRADKYPDAVKRFDELVTYADSGKIESGKESSDLRPEAIQYLGISFAEKDWDGDGTDDPLQGLVRLEEFYRGRENEPHVREIFAKLGDIYFDQTDYLKAIEVYKKLLARYPYFRDNPLIQDKVVTSFDRIGNAEKKLEAIGEIGTTYGPGSAWERENAADKVAIDTARELAENALIKYAVDHHKSAQALKASATAKNDSSLLAKASQEYRLAADGYRNYLEKYPNSKYLYDYTYNYADTLYFSQRFDEAASQFEKVRDSNVDNRFLEDSAFNAVKAYEYMVSLEEKAGKLKIPPNPEVGKVKAPVTPQPIPDLVSRLQASYRAFVERLPKSGRVATLAFKDAELDFKYLDFGKSRPKFEALLATYCSDPSTVANEAANAILLTYTIENNLDKILEWTTKLDNLTCTKSVASAPGAPKPGGSATGLTPEEQRRRLREDVLFQKAMQLYEAGDFEKAGPEFVKIVDGNPKDTAGNNALALNNAAVSFEKVNRFQAATKIYERLVNEYGDSKYTDEALFRVAVNYQKYFEFDKAVISYKRLATDPRFKASSHRTESLFNSALILENDQAYAEAARLYQQYAKEPSVKKEDAQDAAFKSALVLLKAKDTSGAIKSFSEYLKTYPSDAKRNIEAQFRIGESFEQQKNRTGAINQYKKVVDLGSTVAPGTDAAEYPAHASFILAEQCIADLDKLKISGGGKVFQDSVGKYKSKVQACATEYGYVTRYKRATWSLAAFYRSGQVYEMFSKALLAAPCPPEIKALEKKGGAGACDIYAQQIEELVASVDEEAVKRYRITLEQAANLGVSNEWTRQARTRANAYKPDEFPMLKDEHVELQLDDPAGVPPAPLGGNEKAAADTQRAREQLRTGRYEDAISAAKRALSFDERYAPAMVAMAKAYYGLRKFELARAIIDIAKSIDTTLAEGSNLIGFVDIANDNKISATAAFKQATDLNANYATAWNNLSAQYVQAKNYDAALAAGEKATQLVGSWDKAWNNLGSAYRGKGRLEDADRAYRKALELNPRSAEAYFNLGILYLDAPQMPNTDVIGKFTKAGEYLAQYRQLGGARLAKDDPAEAFIEDARKQIERERKRLERQQKKTP